MMIEGVAAVVTGGAFGLGGGTAERLAASGAQVTILDLNGDAGRAAADRIGGFFVRADVTDEEAVNAALAAAEARHGGARVLVNCAGMVPPAKVIGSDGAPMSLGEFGRTITVNLLGTLNMLSRFAARLHTAEPIGEEQGVVVKTASVAAFDGQIGQAAYVASKAGIFSMSLPVARELAQHGIRVMTIAAGIFLTPLLASLPQKAQDSLGAQVSFPNRLGTPDEYARLVEAIVTNSMLNGKTIRLDGAIRMAPR